MSKHNNIDATIGNFYHYLVVIDKLFELNKDEKIIIEVYGDLTKASTNNNIFIENYEVKYHKDSNKLNYSNIDFWKTFKNWIENLHLYNNNTKLILLTTSSLDNELIEFNSKTKDEKLKILTKWKEKTSNTQINSLFSMIFKNKNNLKNILQKVKFKSDQVNYNQMKEQIIKKHHNYFDAFKNHTNIKPKAINYFTGEVIDALKDKNNWEITYEDFMEIKNDFLYKNEPENIKIEDADIISNEEEKIQFKKDFHSNSLYIQKLNDINISEKKLLRASRNKLRAFTFTNILLDNSNSYYKRIKACDKTFTDKWDDLRSNFDFDPNEKINIKRSDEFYNKALEINKLCLHTEDYTESFRKGYWHILADDSDKEEQISWLLKKEEE